jgi:ABC-type sugar transport system permease subunit
MTNVVSTQRSKDSRKKIGKSLRPQPDAPAESRTFWTRVRMVRNFWQEYLLVSPFFLLFAIFFAFPIGWSVLLSFQRWDGIGAARWVGLDNYRFVLSDPSTVQVIMNTIVLLCLLVPLGVILPMLFGVLLNAQFLRLRGLFRTVLFIPVVTSLVVVGIVFRFIFGGEFGWLNSALAALNMGGPYPWLSASGWAYIPIIVLTIWAGLGYSTLVVLGGLQSLDQEVYEAARIDGASEIKIFWQITFPLMRPIMIFLLITSTIGVMRLFNEPYSLFQGERGPDQNALTPAMYIYSVGFGSGRRYGDASALSVLISIVMLAIGGVQFYLLRRQGED